MDLSGDTSAPSNPIFSCLTAPRTVSNIMEPTSSKTESPPSEVEVDANSPTFRWAPGATVSDDPDTPNRKVSQSNLRVNSAAPDSSHFGISTEGAHKKRNKTLSFASEWDASHEGIEVSFKQLPDPQPEPETLGGNSGAALKPRSHNARQTRSDSTKRADNKLATRKRRVRNHTKRILTLQPEGDDGAHKVDRAASSRRLQNSQLPSAKERLWDPKTFCGKACVSVGPARPTCCI